MNPKPDQVPGVAVFRPDAIYSREALESMLADIVEPKRFLARLKIPARFKNAVLGADVLRALQSPPDGALLAEGEENGAVEDIVANVEPKASLGRQRKPSPLAPIRIEEIRRA